jgi:hypothetical protein
MSCKKHAPEQVIQMLCKAEFQLSQGQIDKPPFRTHPRVSPPSGP